MLFLCEKGQENGSSSAAIASLPELPKDKNASNALQIRKQRQNTLERLRNLEDFHHNVTVLLTENNGMLIMGKQVQKLKKPSDYLPCTYCLVFYLKEELWRHAKVCRFRSVHLFENEDQEKNAERQFMTDSKLLLQGACNQPSVGPYEDFHKYVGDRLISDSVSMAIKSDALLLLFGRTQFEKLGKQRAAEVRSKLRIIGRLKLVLREIVNDNCESCL